MSAEDDGGVDLGSTFQWFGDARRDRRLGCARARCGDRHVADDELQALRSLGFTADLLGGSSSHRADIDVANEQLLDERLRMRENLSSRSEDDAVPVEDELVLPAHSAHP